MREIIIFRHNLFKISEPFIVQQAQKLRRYKPLYLGRIRYGQPPAGAESFALCDRGPSAYLRIGQQMLSRSPAPYQSLLRDRHPALIHAHFGIEGVYALPLAKRLHIPLVTTFHGFDATLSTAALLSSPAWANYPLYRRNLAQQGALFLCASSFIRDRILALGFPEARTRTHYIGVDWRAITPRHPSEETRTILHVARLANVKGTKYLIRAFAALASEHSDVDLVIIGDGPRRRALQKLTISLKLERRVHFLGAQAHTEVLAQMRRAAMLVLPSVRTGTGRVEGLGMVLLEAAATGIPVVASRIGGIPEGVLDGRTGFLVPERDIAALTRRMDELLRDPAMRLGMGAQARALVEQRFDIRTQTEVLENLYDEVLSDAR